MTKRFSEKFGTFEEWQAQAKATDYAKKIQRLHAIHPQASLSQLRRHSTKREKPLGQLKISDISKRKWNELTPKEKSIRERSLTVLSQMRRGKKSLTRASKELGISPKTVIKHTNAVKKSDGKWKAKRYDRIPRIMSINENGKEAWIEIDDSRHASTIGKYHNVVKNFLETDDKTELKCFEGKRVKDSDGNWHTLETDAYNIHEIKERKEEEEFFEIYKEG